MAGPIRITLGGNTIDLRPLTLRAVREIDLAFSGEAPADVKEREAFFFDRHVRVVMLAMQRENPTVNEAAILDMESDFQELLAASTEILKASGLVPSGEAKAAPSTGAT